MRPRRTFPEPDFKTARHIPPAAGGAYPPRPGNRVLPLVDGDPAFTRICRAVAGARRSVWVAVAFIEPLVRLPGSGGTLFDLLDRTAARGLDVRALFWRTWAPEAADPGAHFPGSAAERAWLEERGTRFLIRWDRLPAAFCHHQKIWLIDAGGDGETAFVGGINLDRASMSAPGHGPRPEGTIHDLYLEIRGPAATDVHHNIVQRWNGASERRLPDGVWPEAARRADLPFPAELSPARGDVTVQCTRTVRPGQYQGCPPAPGADEYDIGAGECSVREQYLAAIDGARRSIYIENQVIASPAVIARLDAALQRGVEVGYLVPCRAHPDFAAARRNPALAPLFEPLHRLGRHPHFTLAGLVAPLLGEGYQYVYVHAKTMIVDDVWMTVGSTNVADRSFGDDTEMNASLWCPEIACRLRADLFHEHLAEDTSHLDSAAALGRFHRVARKNVARHERGEALQGLALALDPVCYGHPWP